MTNVMINNVPYTGVDTVKLPLLSGEGKAVFVYSHDEISESVQNGYVLLEYIESVGAQYIDTGISGGSSAAYEIVFNPLGDFVNQFEQYFAGTVSNNGVPKLFARHTADAHVISTNAGWSTEDLCVLDNNKHTVRYENREIYFDGGVVPSNEIRNEGGWGDTSWFIFNSSVEPTLLATMRLYSLKMYKDGVLVRDFVPAKRNPDGAIGLLDNVSGTFFENAGTGAFTGA